MVARRITHVEILLAGQEQMKKDTVGEILKSADKADFLEYVKDNIGEATHCLVVFGVPNEQGGLDLNARQLGMSYLFEIMGFLNWVAGMDWDGEEDGEQS